MTTVHTFLTEHRFWFLTFCVLALGGGFAFVSLVVEGGAGSTDPILEIDNDTLTSYLYASASKVQDIFPRDEDRGVNLDGTLRVRPALPIALNGNPFERGMNSATTPIRESNGTVVQHVVDLRLPAKSFSWEISRSYHAGQIDNADSHHTSGGYQGENWCQNSQPEIVLYEGATDDKDVLYLIYAANAFVEYKRISTSDRFKGTNGAAGIFEYQAGTPDLYVLTDQNGNEITFFGFDTSGNAADGQLWKMENPDGDVAYVGDATTASTAVSNGYDSSGRMLYAYDTSDRRYTYSYSTSDIGGAKRLETVVAETKTGGTWASPTGVTEVARVAYDYYGDESNGDPGDLKLVTVTLPMSSSGVDDVRDQYYRYWEGAFHDVDNPGHTHELKLVVDFEGCRNYDWNETGEGEPELDNGFTSASLDNLKNYASAYYEYDSSRQVDEAWFNGFCGCGGASDGLHYYEYESNGSYSDDSGYDEDEWMTRTIVQRPDDAYITQYYDEVHQALSRVLTDDDPDNTSPAPEVWATYVDRDSGGCVSDFCPPENVTAYTHSTASFTQSTSAGLVVSLTRASSGATSGFVTDRKWKDGTSGTAYLDGTWTYSTATLEIGTSTGHYVIRPFVASHRQYAEEITSGTTGSFVRSFSTSVYTDELAIEKIEITEPSVATGENGSGSTDTWKQYFDKDGSRTFQKSVDDIVMYWEYTDGQVTRRIDDADTADSDFSGITIPEGFRSSGSPFHRVTDHTYDAQGRLKTTTLPDTRAPWYYYSNLDDGRTVRLAYTDYEPPTINPAKYFGPVDYTVRNHANRVEASAQIALTSNESTLNINSHVDETDDDAVGAVDSLGSIVHLTTHVYAEPGTQLDESRQYFDTPTSLPGTDGTHYDPTFFGYDVLGRRTRVKEASGTIRRTDYDENSRVVTRWIGTNDSSFIGGESSGTDDMVESEELQYDSGNDKGNGYLTKRTLPIDDTAGNDRVYDYTHDARGRVLLEDNPKTPHALHKYDNLGRRIATGLYSTAPSASSDPTNTATNRMGLTEAYFDDRGKVWKTVLHKIDDADGSDDDTLNALHWYDAAGRLVKVQGRQFVKYTYDRLGRQTHQFVLADDNDTAYADADDVTGDIVLEEIQTTFDTDTDVVLMRGVISRFHDDYGGGQTTGALDSNADSDDLKYTAANLDGRIQITAFWHDAYDREIDRVEYGTYNDADFDRDGLSTPARSDTALRTTTSYNDEGLVEDVTDPMNIVQRRTYDDAGRMTKVVDHYDASVNSGNPYGTDDNRTVKYEFTDGLRTKITADLPSGSTDQDTLYIYGTTDGTPSASTVSSGHLLRAIVYPDSTNTGTTESDINTDDSDVVSFAYNTQGDVVLRKDPAGNVIESDYDDIGRLEHSRVSTLASNFDGAVRRITRSYTSLGQPKEVTQYDNATVGSGNIVDQVLYTWHDWGVVEKVEQDHDSAVGTGTHYEVSYTYAKATNGRATIRRSGITLPSGASVTLQYSTTTHDDDASRVTDVKFDTTVVASYDYLGAGRVVGIDYGEPDVKMELFGATSGTYPDLDRFDRVTDWQWTQYATANVDFVDVDWSYDRNSNVTLRDDQIHDGFDVEYTIDDLNRLTKAEEGTWSGGAITSGTRTQEWTLDHVGNWDVVKLDLNADDDYLDTDELDETRTHNDVNELSARDVDSDSSDDYTLTYDGSGNLTDDAENSKYVYDAFHRLRKVNDQTDTLVAEYKYNGEGWLIQDYKSSTWYHNVYDERWRPIARYDGTDPVEEFVFDEAGPGEAQHRNDTHVFRDMDLSGNLDQRDYYCENWRGDVVAIVDDNGAILEWVKYSAYGVPFGIPGGDTDGDWDCDGTDADAIRDAVTYDILMDIDLNNSVESADETLARDSRHSGKTLGREALTSHGNRKSYAGYEFDVDAEVFHVRRRGLAAPLGRWQQRDPLRYVDGLSMYTYGKVNPLTRVDPLGTETIECGDSKIVDIVVPGASLIVYSARGGGGTADTGVDVEEWYQARIEEILDESYQCGLCEGFTDPYGSGLPLIPDYQCERSTVELLRANLGSGSSKPHRHPDSDLTWGLSVQVIPGIKVKINVSCEDCEDFWTWAANKAYVYIEPEWYPPGWSPIPP